MQQFHIKSHPHFQILAKREFLTQWRKSFYSCQIELFFFGLNTFKTLTEQYILDQVNLPGLIILKRFLEFIHTKIMF